MTGAVPDDTTVVVLTGLTDRRLELVLTQNGLVHNGDPRSQRHDDGTVSNAWDWGIESEDLVVDGAGRSIARLVTYVLPVDDQLFLVGHSLGTLPEYPLAFRPRPGHRAGGRGALRPPAPQVLVGAAGRARHAGGSRPRHGQDRDGPLVLRGRPRQS